jgi:hypothetical protein
MTTEQSKQNELEFQAKFKDIQNRIAKIDLLAIALKDEVRKVIGKAPPEISNLLADFNIQLGIAYNNLNYHINKMEEINAQSNNPSITIKEGKND